MTGAGKDTLVKGKRSCTVLFFSAYFIYYAVYCVFSSFIVLFLTEQGYSATVCGIITSLTFLANLLMEPVGGYITDTFLPTRRYLLVCIGIVSMVCAFCTKFMDQSWLLLPGLVLAAGLAYPFSQLMDAWVNLSKESYPGLIYSRIRAGGSIGFAVMSVIGGFYFKHWGWNRYFQMQILLFLMMIPFLILLPDTRLGNHRKKGEAEKSLSFVQAFQQLVKSRRFLFCLTISTLYWFSHRPVGSFLSLIIAERGGDAAAGGGGREPVGADDGAAGGYVPDTVVRGADHGGAIPGYVRLLWGVRAEGVRAVGRAAVHHIGAHGLSGGIHRAGAVPLRGVRAGAEEPGGGGRGDAGGVPGAVGAVLRRLQRRGRSVSGAGPGGQRAGAETCGVRAGAGHRGPLLRPGDRDTAVLLPHRPAGGGIRRWRFNRFSVGMPCPNKTVFCAAGINEGYLTSENGK